MANRVEILSMIEEVSGLGSRIYSFFSSVKDAPEEVRQMCAQLQLLQKLFPEIGRSTSDLIHATPLVLDIIFVCLKGCESEFRTIWLAVEPLRTNRGIIWRDALRKAVTSVKWVLRTEEFEKLTKNLERLKQTFVLAMLVAGMRVDSIILEGLSFIDTKMDGYGRMLDSHLHSVHKNIAFQLEQLEYRFLQRVGVLSGTAAEIHGQSSLRVTELYDNIALDGSLQTDRLSAIESLDSGVNVTISSCETRDINDLDGFAVENQSADTISQAMRDIKVDDSVPAAFRDVLQQLEFENTYTYTRRKWVEALEVAKRADQLGRAHLTSEYYKILNETLGEMQDAFEYCVREYELYPEPKLKGLITALITTGLSGMTNVLRILPREMSKTSREEHKNFRELTEEYKQDSLKRLEEIIANIRLSFQKVVSEAEYLHRKEMRQAHLRLREIDRKQDQVIRTLEEQQKILISMQEEQKALSLINNHQKVLQMLQQLLSKFPPTSTVGASLGALVNAETSTVSG